MPSDETIEPDEESTDETIEPDEEPTDETIEPDEEPTDGTEGEADGADGETVATDETEQCIGADPARDVFSSVQPSADEESSADTADGADTEALSSGAGEAATGGDEAPDAGESAGTESAGMVFCRQCGERIATTATACPNCGAPQDASGGSGGREEKDPGIAALASLVVPGAGQLYNGQFVRGAVAFVGVGIVDVLLVLVALVLSLILIGPLFLLLIPVVHVLVAYDAYDQAKKINRGDADPDS